MISKNIFIIIGILFITLSMKSVGAQEWYDGDGGKVKWQYDCDFPGNDIGSAGELCSSLCINTDGCSHFSYFEGVCHVKKAPSGIPRHNRNRKSSVVFSHQYIAALTLISYFDTLLILITDQRLRIACNGHPSLFWTWKLSARKHRSEYYLTNVYTTHPCLNGHDDVVWEPLTSTEFGQYKFERAEPRCQLVKLIA
uniref:Apple domain-containing protein n=1 Tax=Daphnia galeata TaxID=27404 RepID=A0A8J2WJ53_9CRUS|nr:unnamed protein product [Daphnia galeata]